MSEREATRLVWYFDFVSPYSYLQFDAYSELMHTAGRCRAQVLNTTV